jgi:acetate kinase
VYLWRLRKYLGAYLCLVGNPHAVIFTDTIGELVPEVRAAVCGGLGVFGLELDQQRNASAQELPVDLATPESRVRILAIATNEELAIARRTYALCQKTSHPGDSPCIS